MNAIWKEQYEHLANSITNDGCAYSSEKVSLKKGENCYRFAKPKTEERLQCVLYRPQIGKLQIHLPTLAGHFFDRCFLMYRYLFAIMMQKEKYRCFPEYLELKDGQYWVQKAEYFH